MRVCALASTAATSKGERRWAKGNGTAAPTLNIGSAAGCALFCTFMNVACRLNLPVAVALAASTCFYSATELAFEGAETRKTNIASTAFFAPLIWYGHYVCC